MKKFALIPIDGVEPKKRVRLVRLNCLGNLFYFIRVALGRERLTETLHKPICDLLEQEWIKLLLEIPRDHFKTTICSEGFPMWRALPISHQDEDLFLKCGYDDEFVKHMHRMHDPDVRILVVSENITNAAKFGGRVRWHFESNSLYRSLFYETLPTTKETWTNYSLHIRRTKSVGAAHGEGTFDFIGVGGALQSRHYSLAIEDDLPGLKAIESESVMEKTIDFHRLIVGAFESRDRNHEAPELVVGNRWGFHDLNSWIRENEPWFKVYSHSAEGGCCKDHPSGEIIFPEEFSAAKLQKIRARLGNHHYSCQFQNNPASPDNADFKEEWLKFFETKTATVGPGMEQQFATHVNARGEKQEWDTDVAYGQMEIAILSDPAHSGNAGEGRCRHSIVVVGKYKDRLYLLDCWAEHTSPLKYVEQLYAMAKKWKKHRIGLETIGGQRFLATHIEHRNNEGDWYLKVVDLKGEVESASGKIVRKKEFRIRESLSPYFEQGRFYTKQQWQNFIQEYISFPKGKYLDILDALAYAPDLLRSSMTEETWQGWKSFNNRRVHEMARPYAVQ